MRLQVDNKFQQVNIKVLNDQNNVEMLTTLVRGGKAFAEEQKISELKTRISKLNHQNLKISPTKIIWSSASNMNSVKSGKYRLTPEKIEKKKSLSSETFQIYFKMHIIEKKKLLHDRRNRYDKKKYSRKRRN